MKTKKKIKERKKQRIHPKIKIKRERGGGESEVKKTNYMRAQIHTILEGGTATKATPPSAIRRLPRTTPLTTPHTKPLTYYTTYKTADC